MGQYQSIYNGSQIDDCVSQAVRTIVQQLTDEQKAQVRTNIGAGTYSIPSGGIPKTSLTTDVQTSLSKADNALPLSGGTLSGALAVDNINSTDGNGLISYHPSGWNGVSNTQWGVGAVNSQGVIRSNNSDLIHYKYGNNSFAILDSSNYSNYALPKSGGTIQNGSQNYPLVINSTDTKTWMYFQCGGVNKTSVGYWNNISYVANEVASGYPRIGVTDAGNPEFWVNGVSNKYAIHTSRDGATFGGSIRIHSDGDAWNEGIRMHLSSNNWCGIVMCGSDNTGATGTSAKTWSIHNNDGNFYIAKNGSNSTNSNYFIGNKSGSWIVSSGWNNISDIRKKNIIENNKYLSIASIANAPSFTFKWKSITNDSIHVGSSAQYWSMVLPEAVNVIDDDMHTLSMQYEVISLISSISIARKVVEQEKTIKLQDTRIKELEKIVGDIQSELDKQKL